MNKIRRTGESISGFPDLSIVVYGEKIASDFRKEFEQGYAIFVKGIPVARNLLLKEARDAVDTFLRENYPEHSGL
jgi:hypothetical protein